MKNPRSILITGASNGIGSALAEAYAQNDVTLALLGRHAVRLAEVAERCRQRGARVVSVALDVTDAAQMAAWISEHDRSTPVDLVIANAGISAQSGGRGESEDQARRIFAINVGGVMNTVNPLIGPMAARHGGQIAIMSSLASFRGFPGSAAYCASKAAIRVWGEALRGELASSGVTVSVICPGFVVTSMTATNDFHMPLLMPVERAARIIIRGLAVDRPRIAFPWRLYAASWLMAALPPGLADRLIALRPPRD